ncbi:MAG: transcription antitermination protein NusB [Propionibacteriaceae bacterium]|nr:transcription antitermination protein NusB [Propionibacteriaceae bacterium]
MPTEPDSREATLLSTPDVLDVPVITLPAWQHPPVTDAVVVKVLDDGTPHHHSRQTKARKAALDVLYQAEMRGLDPLTLLAESADLREQAAQIVKGVRAELLIIDTAIMEVSPTDWTITRLAALDRNLARIAVWELKNGTPAAVVISEAVALADEYSTDSSAAFLSGILGAIAEMDALRAKVG